jgi:hypothetical protein
MKKALHRLTYNFKMGGSNQATADTLPRFPRATLTVQLDADIKTNVDLAILTPGYTFATPVWGGRLGLNLYIPVGTSFGDPAPQLSLKWNQGVNNYMVYSASWDNGFGYTVPIIRMASTGMLTWRHHGS